MVRGSVTHGANFQLPAGATSRPPTVELWVSLAIVNCPIPNIIEHETSGVLSVDVERSGEMKVCREHPKRTRAQHVPILL